MGSAFAHVKRSFWLLQMDSCPLAAATSRGTRAQAANQPADADHRS